MPAAIQHRGIIVSEDPQQPPYPAGPPHIGGAVEHDPCVGADAEPAHGRGEMPDRRQHETECMPGIRQVILNVGKLRAGDVTALKILAT